MWQGKENYTTYVHPCNPFRTQVCIPVKINDYFGEKRMKRKIIAIGLICTTLLTGCGSSLQPKQNTKDADSTASTSATVDSTTKGDKDLAERAKESYTLNIDFSTEETIPMPEDARLFYYDLTLPINFEDLLDYKVYYHYISDEDFLTLRDCIEKYPSDGDNYEDIRLYPKDSADYETADEYTTTVPELSIYDKEDALQSNIDNNNWSLEKYIPNSVSLFNITSEDCDEEMNEAGEFTYDYSYEEWMLDKLIERLGSPNYINIYGGNDMTDIVNGMLSADGEVHANTVLLGWIFEDCSVTIDYSVVANENSDGEYDNDTDMDCNSVTYYPYKWTGKVEGSNAEWSNQVKEFVAARDEILGN